MNRTGALRVAAAGVDPETLALPEGVVPTGDIAASDLVVCVGESTLRSVSGRDVPALPVDAGRGLRSVPRERLADALEAVADGEHEQWSIPTLSVTVDGEYRADALLDAMLVTARPAHISEFGVRTPTERVDQFRADGVHVATAAGTSGYARRVDAPVFDPSIAAAVVVPIAPFSIDADHWVVPLRDGRPVVEVTVEREDAAVTLLADDRSVGPVAPDEPVTITADGSVGLVRVPQSRSPFSGPDGGFR